MAASKPSAKSFSGTKSEMAERVAALLVERPDMTSTELADLLGMERSSTVRRYLTDARRAATAA